MATNPTASATIPVRLNLLIRIDPAQWTADQAPAIDADVIAKALIGAGITEEQATAMAAQLAARPTRTPRPRCAPPCASTCWPPCAAWRS